MLYESFKNDIATGALKMFKPNDLASMAGYISQYRLSEYLLWDYIDADGYDFECTREQLLKLNPNLKPYLKDINLGTALLITLSPALISKFLSIIL